MSDIYNLSKKFPSCILRSFTCGNSPGDWGLRGRHKRIHNHSLALTCHALPSLGNWPPGIMGVVLVCHWVCLCVPRGSCHRWREKSQTYQLMIYLFPTTHLLTHQTGLCLTTHSKNIFQDKKQEIVSMKSALVYSTSTTLSHIYSLFVSSDWAGMGYDALTLTLCCQRVWVEHKVLKELKQLFRTHFVVWSMHVIDVRKEMLSNWMDAETENFTPSKYDVSQNQSL